MLLLQSEHSIDGGEGGEGCFFRRDGAEKRNVLPSCAHKARQTRPQAVDVGENKKSDLQVVLSGNGGFDTSNNPSDSRGCAQRFAPLGRCGCGMNLGASRLNQH